MEEKKTYKIVPSGKKAERRNYSKVSGSLDLPNLVEIQTDSFEWFVNKGIREVFEEAYDHLVVGGNLWIVIRKNHGAQSAKKFIEGIFGNCEIIRKDKGYYILKSQKK